MGAICTDRCHNRDPLSTAILPRSCEAALLIQLACEDSASLLQLADEETLLVYVVDIVSTYFVFFYLLTNDGEVRLVVTPRLCSVTCEVVGVEISGIKPGLVSCHEAPGPAL
jgi:hypothetical protein